MVEAAFRGLHIQGVLEMALLPWLPEERGEFLSQHGSSVAIRKVDVRDSK
jgi:hypothetical protein